MRIYYDSGAIDEWSITFTLKLEDDGRFLYDELWSCYVGSAWGSAEGRWWQSGKTIFFHTERVEGNIYLNLVQGQDKLAVEEGDAIKFSEGGTYRLHNKSAHNLQSSSEGNSLPAAIVPDDAAPSSAAESAPGKPRTLRLSIELSARIRQWIEELSAGSIQSRIAYLGKKYSILPLHTNNIYMWALSLDGVVVWLDHESSSDRPEPVTNPVIIYAVMVHGARNHRQLAEMIPPCPEGARQCKLCGGMGWIKSEGKMGESWCVTCQGFGWYIPSAVR